MAASDGVLAFCGFEVLAPFVAHAVPYLTNEQRRHLLDAWRQRLQGIADERPQAFHRREDFDSRWQLRSDVAPVTVGHGFARLPPVELAQLRGKR